MERYEISAAQWPRDMDVARSLLTNYGRYLAASPVAAAGFSFADYETQISGLPGNYATQKADLLLARVASEGAGCVAIASRLLADGTESAEMKRLWVEPQFRGMGIGRGLVLSAIAWARQHSFAALMLDTVNDAMPEASGLYRSLGFEEITRFNDNPIDGVRFYRLPLSL